MSKNDDRVFVKHFSWILAGLAVFSLIIAFVAYGVHLQLVPSENPSRMMLAEQRIEPVGAVYTGEAGREALAAAEAQASAGQAAPFDGSLDGEMLYTQVCSSCHISGAAGAPQLVADQWTDRLTKGEEQLHINAINGIGVMPAKGGRTDLTDEQVIAAVDYMLTEVQ